MPKFSIIIPMYNSEKYIKKCLESIMNQTFKDYEVIVVNDGSTDNSLDIVKEYDVRIIDQKNKGVSAARNIGIKAVKGEYFLFVDSDDFIERDLLKKLNEQIDNSPDIVRFQTREVFENGKKIDYPEESFNNKSGVEAFASFCQCHYIDNAAGMYLFNTNFFKKNQFNFREGTVHEDFGLLPLVIIKANRVNSISYIGYNYLQHDGSIMNEKNYEKTKKKVADMFLHYQYLISEIDKTNLDSKVYKSFIANSLILKICELKGKEYKEYLKKLKEEKVVDNLLDDTLARKIKKRIIKFSPKLAKRITNP